MKTSEVEEILVRLGMNVSAFKDEKGNSYCYVTMICKKKKHTYELKYAAIMLNGHWFVGDELSFKEVEE